MSILEKKYFHDERILGKHNITNKRAKKWFKKLIYETEGTFDDSESTSGNSLSYCKNKEQHYIILYEN